jgi:hypothetical protein
MYSITACGIIRRRFFHGEIPGAGVIGRFPLAESALLSGASAAAVALGTRDFCVVLKGF